MLSEFARHMVATGGSLYLLKDNGLKKMYTLDPDHAPDFIPLPLPEKSIMRQVMETGCPLLIQDIQKISDFEPSGWNGYKDGSLLSFPIPDADGKTVGILTLHSKIDPPFLEQDKEIGSILASYSCETLRAVQAFEALQKSEKRYRTLFERSNDAIFIEKTDTGHYLDANAAAADLTGRSRDELKEMTAHEIMQGPNPLIRENGNLLRNSRDLVKVKRPDNTRCIARVSTVPLDQHSRIRIARDITNDLELERQLRQSQKMEALGTLAGGIAHDFNNILASIYGYSDLLLLNLNKPEAARKNVDQILKGARRASDLVQQILTFSRQAEQKRVPLKIYLLVKEVIKFLRSSIPANVTIEDRIVSKSRVFADPTQIHQVVMNLCTNAYHAMGKTGGILTVSLEDRQIKKAHDPEPGYAVPPGRYAQLTVKDTGHGMAADILDKIFDPYFTTKKPDKGTGLGLAVVSGIIEKHRGIITVESRPGQGTAFRVFFPVVGKSDIIEIEKKTESPR